jgi:hypothetical protein
MRTMKFFYHAHPSVGEAVTVRKGARWAHRLSPGERICLVSAHGLPHPLTAEVVASSCLLLCDISRQDLRDHHDYRVAHRMVAKSDLETPIKGDFQELCRQMLAYYGSIKLDTVVSVIRYRLVDEDLE